MIITIILWQDIQTTLITIVCLTNKMANVVWFSCSFDVASECDPWQIAPLQPKLELNFAQIFITNFFWQHVLVAFLASSFKELFFKGCTLGHLSHFVILLYLLCTLINRSLLIN